MTGAQLALTAGALVSLGLVLAPGFREIGWG